MKISFTLAFVLGSASAFAPRATFLSMSPPASSTELTAHAQSRQAFLAQAGAGLAALTVLRPQAAVAAKYGGFGAGSPEVLDPTAAEVDREALKGGDVQQAIADVRAFQATVRNMQAALAADPQASLRGTLTKDFDFAKLRGTFNTFNKAFEEDTQRGTDRLIRVILQDITELDVASAQKPGIPRSEKRLTAINGKLRKLDQAFEDLLAFVK